MSVRAAIERAVRGGELSASLIESAFAEIAAGGVTGISPGIPSSSRRRARRPSACAIPARK